MSEANELRGAIVEITGELISVRNVAGEAMVSLGELDAVLSQVILAVALNGVDQVALLGEPTPEAMGQIKIATILSDLVVLLRGKAELEGATR